MPNPEQEKIVDAGAQALAADELRGVCRQDTWRARLVLDEATPLIERALLEEMLFFVKEKRVKGNTTYRQHPMSQLPRDFAKEKRGIDLSGEG